MGNPREIVKVLRIVVLGICFFWPSFTGAQNFMSGGGTREDLFSATSKLEELIAREAEIVRMLDRYLEVAQARLEAIKTYVKDYRMIAGGTSERIGSSRHGGRVGGDSGGGRRGGEGVGDGGEVGEGYSSVVAHPVDAYLLLKRLTVEWESVEDTLTQHTNATQELVQRVVLFRDRSSFPVINDLHGAAVALVRLQDTYQLNMTTLPHGTFTGVGGTPQEFRSAKRLNGRDCLFLGKHAFTKGYYDKAIEWFEAALDLAILENDTSAPKDEIEPYLQAAIKVHDDVLEKRGPRGIDWKTNPQPLDKTLARKDKYRGDRGETKFMAKLYQLQSDSEEEEHYTRLCRGEKLRGPELEAGLKCRLMTNGRPYLRLMPQQLEEMSLDPYIAVIHDFLTPHQTDTFISRAKPKLMTSRHRSPDGGFISSMVRTSKNAWLRDTQGPDDFLVNVTKKIEAVTNLRAIEASAAEDYQVANYGIGGLYVTHTDFVMLNSNPASSSPWEQFIGDRLATFMVYLSDVEAGGATVFPRVGVTIWPKKGAGVFWWNLFRSGVGDENTRHGGCPVLHGSKWISNKWIHYNDQFLRHTCGFNTWDKLQTPLAET